MCDSRRYALYLDPATSWSTAIAEKASPVENAAGFSAEEARGRILATQPFERELVKSLLMHPFDLRWGYITHVTGI